MATFRKTNQGEWVVFGTLDEVVVGTVMVTKKGQTKLAPVNVERVGKPFSVDGRQMVYGYLAPKGAKSAPPSPPPPSSPKPMEMDWSQAEKEDAGNPAPKSEEIDFF